MRWWPWSSRRSVEPGGSTSPGLRVVRPRFAAVEEALANDGDVAAELIAVAHEYAHEGLPLSELLSDFYVAHQEATRSKPSVSSVRMISEAWAAAFEAEMGALSCKDPTTGLATISHLRLRLFELFRSGDLGPVGEPTVDVVGIRIASSARRGRKAEVEQRLRLALVGETAISVLAQCDTVASIGDRCVVALVRSGPDSDRRLRLLREILIDKWGDLEPQVRTFELPYEYHRAVHLVHSLPHVDWLPETQPGGGNVEELARFRSSRNSDADTPP